MESAEESQYWLPSKLADRWADEWCVRQADAQAAFVEGEGWSARVPKSATYWATRAIAEALVGLASYPTRIHAAGLLVLWESDIALADAQAKLAVTEVDRTALAIRSALYAQALAQVRAGLIGAAVGAERGRTNQA